MNFALMPNVPNVPMDVQIEENMTHWQTKLVSLFEDLSFALEIFFKTFYYSSWLSNRALGSQEYKQGRIHGYPSRVRVGRGNI